MEIIGRKREQDILEQCLESKRPEFLAIYGRRRIGKTYLIKEYFANRFSFYSTGILNSNTSDALSYFNDSLKKYGCTDEKPPKNWIEAFNRLIAILESVKVRRDPISNKMVVFLDEISWMDTPRSNFRGALDYFWNSWASSNPDILLIICGSATSWILDNIIGDKGGFYNRVTRQIHLQPFSLSECEKLIQTNGIIMSKNKVIECYMAFGGVPFYLNMLDKRLSLDQNINELLINPIGELHNEYDRLFQSLFRNYPTHLKIIDILAERRNGFNRQEIIKKLNGNSGEIVTKSLAELEQCDFIRKYNNGTSEKRGCIYQIIDPFILFYHYFIKSSKVNSWVKYLNTPSYNAWCGFTFEIVCLNHISNIKNAIGISGIETNVYSWKSVKSSPGAQIDLVIDRSDDVITLCEMKYSSNEYEMDAKSEKDINNKIYVFKNETNTKKAVHMMLVTPYGLKKNIYSDCVLRTITADDLFD